VTSRHADDRLWAEALNLGAWDVLAKPFDPGEVVRVVNLACLCWQRERQAAVQSVAAQAAAGGM
jgi:DNA-binding response OmpR family regulator